MAATGKQPASGIAETIVQVKLLTGMSVSVDGLVLIEVDA